MKSWPSATANRFGSVRRRSSYVVVVDDDSDCASDDVGITSASMTISSSSSSFARARVDRRVERVRLDVVVARRVAILVVDARVVVIIIGRVTVWRKDLGPDSMTTAERARDAWRDALEASTTGTSSSSPPPIAGVERARGRRATSQHQNHQHTAHLIL